MAERKLQKLQARPCWASPSSVDSGCRRDLERARRPNRWVLGPQKNLNSSDKVSLTSLEKKSFDPEGMTKPMQSAVHPSLPVGAVASLGLAEVVHG